MWTNHLLLRCKTAAMLFPSCTLMTLNFCTIMLFSAFFIAAVHERPWLQKVEPEEFTDGGMRRQLSQVPQVFERKSHAMIERQPCDIHFEAACSQVPLECHKTVAKPQFSQGLFTWPKPNKHKPDKYQRVLHGLVRKCYIWKKKASIQKI